MTEYYKEKLEAGLEYQDFIADQLRKSDPCIILGAYLDGVGNTICLPYRASGGTWYMSFWTGINLSSYTPSNATLIVMYRDL